MKPSNLKWASALLLGLASLATQAQDAASYPAKPVTLVVPPRPAAAPTPLRACWLSAWARR